MTILATNIARSRGLSLLTDDVVAEPLANRAVRGDLPRQTPGSLAEGLLATMVLRTLHVSPSTPLKKLRAFKEDHQRELGEFKNALRELVKPIKGKTDLELLQKHLATVHKNQVAPKIGALQERLSDNRIACGYNNLKVSTLVSASPTALGVGMAAVGLGPFALVAGIGVSILLSLSNYELQKRELLRESPFSYVVLAEKKFSPRRK
jgi:hypothetical protein